MFFLLVMVVWGVLGLTQPAFSAGGSAHETVALEYDAALQVSSSDFNLIPLLDLLLFKKAGEPTLPPSESSGHVTFTVFQESGACQVFRIEARQDAEAQNVSTALDKLSPVDSYMDCQLNSAPDGSWLVLNSTRFDQGCADWSCLALVKGDLSSGEAVMAGGNLVHPEGWSAIASSGNFIAFGSNDGNHGTDIFGISRSDNSGEWGGPFNLTASSTFPFNQSPSISDDGSKVLFSCGLDSYDQASVCEVSSDGTGFRVAVPAASAGDSTFLNSPDYGVEGSIVFEEAEHGEQIWRLPAGSTAPVKITDQFFNDNSPCVLPDGSIASLLIREEAHELKIMTSDGSSYYILMPGVDIFDVGLGCGK